MEVYLYIDHRKRNGKIPKQGKYISDRIAKNIAEIEKKMFISIIKVTTKNVKEVSKKKIKKLPACIIKIDGGIWLMQGHDEVLGFFDSIMSPPKNKRKLVNYEVMDEDTINEIMYERMHSDLKRNAGKGDEDDDDDKEREARIKENITKSMKFRDKLYEEASNRKEVQMNEDDIESKIRKKISKKLDETNTVDNVNYGNTADLLESFRKYAIENEWNSN